ncbi:TadE/TadG family type IV pilus assembly protein [Phyllobacterium sp. 628]|uniref:TadE/TadG family type IV pilus assembly protein n=1 Tax=Phyllobacterium sp. 628 TaxID=2718938 RepID=UPI0035301630
MIFAIIEVSLSFTAQQAMSNAVDDLARQLRTGQKKVVDVDNAVKLKKLLCGQLFMAAAPCPDLEVDLQTYATFKAVPKTFPVNANNDVDVAQLQVKPGAAGTINQMRIFYRWPILTDPMKSRIATIKDQGKTLLFSTVTWRNEPYL